ncbi:MAG: aminodeoxychorismate lyase [Candidatus Thiodiazotropha sp. (ex Myrtea spinifera)]|nr:aminodeoxychorismate lyase [Candidatus Thiodiazotropha sp. (ex Myrtea spinifera)]MCU7830970.1 aminodeoxychorismate lyase [Candidatus Thiodiazotropha sp. (ex Myrtea sp. 'scaly one' KF741663)]
MLLNGLPAEQIPLTDRGLHYGDGLFETLAVMDAEPRFWDRHMARLARGEAALKLPPTDKTQLYHEAQSICQSTARGVLKILITRGSGGRGYRPPETCEPRRILSLHPWPDYPNHWFSQGIRMRVCETRLSRNPRLAGHKHLNRLEQVLARQEWQDPDIAEGLMLDEQGMVVSGTQSNLFVIVEGKLMTPDLSYSGVTGIMREVVIECAERLGLPLLIKQLDLATVKSAQAMFITNSLMGLCPVASVDEHHYALSGIPHNLQQVLCESIEQGV